MVPFHGNDISSHLNRWRPDVAFTVRDDNDRLLGMRSGAEQRVMDLLKCVMCSGIPVRNLDRYYRIQTIVEGTLRFGV